MRDLAEIIRDNRAAVAAGHTLQPGAVGAPQEPDKQADAQEPDKQADALDPRRAGMVADFLDMSPMQLAEYATDMALRLEAVSDKLKQRERTKVNVMLLAAVHRVGEGTIGGTIMHPYIEAADDPVLPRLGQLLLKRFEEVTAPPAPGEVSPVWGEFNAGPEKEAEQQSVRTPEASRPLVLVRP